MAKSMKALLNKVKANLILEHDEDDELIRGYIAAALAYAEAYQHKASGYYTSLRGTISPLTEQAVIMLSSNFYESRDGSTGSFFPDKAYLGTANPAWGAINSLLRLGREVVL